MKSHAAMLAQILVDVVSPEVFIRIPNFSWELTMWIQSLERQGNHGLAGQLHEAVGLIDVMNVKARPNEALDHLLMGIWSLNLAAHSYRKVGEHELARIAGQRALWELNQLVVDGELRTDRYHDPFRIWYVLEMMGDASVCADPTKARQFYEAARAGFAQMDSIDQLAEDAEIFPGDYMVHFVNQFLPEAGLVRANGVGRVDVKLRHWT